MTIKDFQESTPKYIATLKIHHVFTFQYIMTYSPPVSAAVRQKGVSLEILPDPLRSFPFLLRLIETNFY